MGNTSATDVGKILLPGVPVEWLHRYYLYIYYFGHIKYYGIRHAFSLGGEQKSKNLVFGTAAANSYMMVSSFASFFHPSLLLVVFPPL